MKSETPLQTGHPDALLASQLHLALAKLCEHQLGRLQEALTHAAHSGLAEGDEASLHRRARLERKRSARSPV